MNWGRIVHKGDASNLTAGWALYVDNGDEPLQRVGFKRAYSTANGVWYTPANLMTLNAWHHVVVTYTDGGTPSIYIDGVAQTITQFAPTGTPDDDASYSLTIGNNSAGTRTFAGNIDKVAAYKRVLNATEVQTLYDEPLGLSND